MARFLPLLCLLIYFSAPRADAQIDQTYHQVIKIDDLPRLLFNIRGDFTLHSWSSSSLMIETYIKLDKGNMDILKYLIKSGRYDLTVEKGLEAETFSEKTNRESALKMKNGICAETVKIDIYIPEDYRIVNGREAERKQPGTIILAGKN